MLRTLFSLLLFGVLLIAPANEKSVDAVQKILYLNYVHIPKRVIKGEIFSVTVKTVSIISDFEDIEYTLSNAKGIATLNDGIPYRKEKERYFLDTFYFQATDTNVRLPDITATLKDYFGTSYEPTILHGTFIEAIALNPKEDFCNIIAKDFVIKHYKTTSYDDTHNIVVFIAEAKQTFLKNFYLQHVFKQGFESLNDTIESSRMTYYAVIEKKRENLHFSYFNSKKNDYITLNIPIIVEEDSVATQSDLKPKDDSKKRFKIFIALGIVFIGILLLLWRGRIIYVFMILLPGIYTVYLMIPTKQVCIKAQSKIRILPLENSTVFEVTQKELHLNKMGSNENFIKIELPNNKIGWVKNEDLCSY